MLQPLVGHTGRERARIGLVAEDDETARNGGHRLRESGWQRVDGQEVGALLELLATGEVAVAGAHERAARRVFRQAPNVKPALKVSDPYRGHQVVL